MFDVCMYCRSQYSLIWLRQRYDEFDCASKLTVLLVVTEGYTTVVLLLFAVISTKGTSDRNGRLCRPLDYVELSLLICAKR